MANNLYSAYVDEWATMACFFAPHVIGVCPRKMQKLVVDLWSKESPTQYEIENAVKVRLLGFDE